MLTALKVKHAKPGLHTDRLGLCLLVRPTGARFWILRVQHHGKRQDFGLGTVREVSLDEARLAAHELRQKIKKGRHFREASETASAAPKKERQVPTFEAAARECYDALKDGWQDRRRRNWLASFEQHVFPMIGSEPVNEIDSAAVRDVLAPIWLKIPDTARRLLQRIAAVLDFAHVKRWRSTETSLRTVRKGLPRQSDRANHYKALPFDAAPSLVQKLEADVATVGRDTLRFLIYTACRSGEARGATWAEIDMVTGLWSIPADRMKAREAHTVPLSPQAIEILQRRWKARLSDVGLIFSINGEKPISDMGLAKVLRTAGLPDVTVHGFRSTFTDWAAEKTTYPKEIADKALAHRIPDRVEAAYRRTDFLDKRRRLMKLWAQYLHRQAKSA
ncbi:integrase arm-type DNA-binding domain-containing protein [Sphingomonas sp. So64.6b]|uniref:tyrosine-type recombinase/integrase n=1 Tax=Sphingomonas sp. So64.6b TaxID=2997354 RepID=UPI0016030136|nr:site-specific integrase [Sphingomonas sp. So64.6b]QNA82963.1 integrase arm-type DNA-binding domain-containing protein [Sphingomonas sp. So64.6b]